MRGRAAGALIVLAFSWACKKPVPPLERSSFEQAWGSVMERPPCSTRVPSHWSPSQPVPSLENGRLVYRMFFFGRDGSKKDGFTFYRAQAVAAFAPDGKVLDCRLTRDKEIPIPKEAPSPMSQEEFWRAERELYPLIERLGKAYASGRAPTEAEKKDVAELMGKYRPWFSAGHEQDYRDLSPGFWAWVEKNGGN